MAEALPQLLKRLRVERGLSQVQLAEAAGIARSTVADLESASQRSPYPETGLRLFKIFMQVLPLRKNEAYQLLDALEVSRGVFHTTLEELEAGRASGETPMVASGSAVHARESHVLVDQLIATVGAEAAMMQLRALLVAETSRKAASGRLISVHHPPQQSRSIPGAIEQQVTHYEQGADQPGEPAPTQAETPSKHRARKID